VTPEFSAIICTYNRCESLRDTLQSLEQMTVPEDLRWDLTVIDNNSVDQTKQVVQQFSASALFPVNYVFESRPGLSYARNTGIQCSKGRIIAFTDDDVMVDKSWLVNIRAAFQEHNCKALGGKIVPVWPGPPPQWFQEDGPFATPRAIVSFDLGNEPCIAEAYPCGANMAFMRELFNRYGNFRVDLGRLKDTLLGGEDFEFFRRIKEGGDQIFYAPGAVVFHPVTKDRLDRRYFEAWCFNGGKSAVRFEGLPKEAIYYFGFPRFHIRALLENAVKYLFTFDPKRRFYYKLQLYIIAGRITEARKLTSIAT
jgi:glycosyltransferase involved in cell wall biosynthesis